MIHTYLYQSYNNNFDLYVILCDQKCMLKAKYSNRSCLVDIYCVSILQAVKIEDLTF